MYCERVLGFKPTSFTRVACARDSHFSSGTTSVVTYMPPPTNLLTTLTRPRAPTHTPLARFIPELISIAGCGNHTQPVAQLLLLQVSLGEVLQVVLADGLGDIDDDLGGGLGDGNVISQNSCLRATGGLELVVQEFLLFWC